MTKEFRMRWWRATLMPLVRFRWIPWGFLALLSACASVPQQNDWITVGQTTRDEVIDAYGQPDLVTTTADGETVVYRSRGVSRSAPPMEIPTVQAGPLGTTITKMESIKPGTGGPVNGGRLRRNLERELSIRYDGQGIVQEVIY
jgi:hypothetical protein